MRKISHQMMKALLFIGRSGMPEPASDARTRAALLRRHCIQVLRDGSVALTATGARFVRRAERARRVARFAGPLAGVVMPILSLTAARVLLFALTDPESPCSATRRRELRAWVADMADYAWQEAEAQKHDPEAYRTLVCEGQAFWLIRLGLRGTEKEAERHPSTEGA